jgi:GTP cyclohydrolase I
MKRDLPTSAVIRERIQAAGAAFCANDNIAGYVSPEELLAIQREVETHVKALLGSLVIDTETDHNTKDTAERVAKMFVQEVFKGRYLACPGVTDFPNAKALDEIYTVGPITVRSTCSHHLVPIVGQAWIGVIPGDRVIGLSKFTRLTEWVLARPQIQEEAAIQLADEIEKRIKPMALAVAINAQHMCMTWRGVRDCGTSMITSVMRGRFRVDAAARGEVISLMKAQGFQ